MSLPESSSGGADELTRALSTVDGGDDVWSQEDEEDLAAFSLSYGAATYPENEDLI
jgi:hypothetical protein